MQTQIPTRLRDRHSALTDQLYRIELKLRYVNAFPSYTSEIIIPLKLGVRTIGGSP